MSRRQGNTQAEEEHARVTKSWHWQRMVISATEKFMSDGKQTLYFLFAFANWYKNTKSKNITKNIFSGSQGGTRSWDSSHCRRECFMCPHGLAG